MSRAQALTWKTHSGLGKKSMGPSAQPPPLCSPRASRATLVFSSFLAATYRSTQEPSLFKATRWTPQIQTLSPLDSFLLITTRNIRGRQRTREHHKALVPFLITVTESLTNAAKGFGSPLKVHPIMSRKVWQQECEELLTQHPQ